VEVEAEAVHWAPLGEMGLGRGVLIGVRVTGGGEALASLLEGQGGDVVGGAAAPEGSGRE
jgi:hypothetical protein